MKIYIKIPRQKSVREFIHKMFSGATSSFEHATYSNKECTYAQCARGKLRSFDDLLDIVQTEYPSITPKKLVHLLITTVPKGRFCHPQLYCCGTMMRIRFLYNHTVLTIDPFKVQRYNSKYSWTELLNMLGIANKEQYDAYIKKNKERYEEKGK